MIRFLEVLPLVSIIMPVYNCERFVSEAIDSVLNQTYGNFELLVIDDASQDSTAHILQTYAEKDGRIRYMTNPTNIGVSQTRNRGIEEAKGEWLAFLDSDDVWIPEKLEKQLGAATQKNVQMVYGGHRFINESGAEIGRNFKVPESCTYISLRKQNFIPLSFVLIRKEALGTLRFERDDVREDYLLWLRVLKDIGLAVGLDEPLGMYRIVTNSRSSNKLRMIGQTYRVHRVLGTSPLVSTYFTFSHLASAYLQKHLWIK